MRVPQWCSGLFCFFGHQPDPSTQNSVWYMVGFQQAFVKQINIFSLISNILHRYLHQLMCIDQYAKLHTNAICNISVIQHCLQELLQCSVGRSSLSFKKIMQPVKYHIKATTSAAAGSQAPCLRRVYQSYECPPHNSAPRQGDKQSLC